MSINEILSIKEHADRVTAFIDFLNVTRSEFCKKIGVTRSALSRYISGKRVPTLEIAVNIAAAYDVSIFDIWGVFKND